MKVRAFEYVPVRSGSVLLMTCDMPIVTESLETGAVHDDLEKVTSSGVRDVCSDQAIPLPQRLQIARLAAVYQLIVGDAVEHIRHLTIGPINGKKVHVKFIGTRRRKYSNVEPVDIEIEGDCELTD